MAITRSQYITTTEYTEITGGSTTDLEIQEASELLKYHCWDFPQVDDYTTSDAPNDLKLATAYQVQFNEQNSGNDFEYAGASKQVTIGKTSETQGYSNESLSQEYRKIAPKARRYLIDGGLLRRIVC